MFAFGVINQMDINMPGTLMKKMLKRGRYDFGELSYKPGNINLFASNVKMKSIFDTSSLKNSGHRGRQFTEQVANGKVLVTGASGFIASHCIKLLQESGYEVRGTVRSLKDAKKVAPLLQLCANAKHKLELVEADLLGDSLQWEEAVAGCTYVLHVASPFPNQSPSDEQLVIKPAVEGTLNVLRACSAVEGVKRVVLTSSVAAIAGQSEPDFAKSYDESDWTDLSVPVKPYEKSKTLAEKAAWDYHNNLQDGTRFELVTINPSYVMGPICHGSSGTSQELIGRLLKRQVPALPNISIEMCDVRDVALAHVQAMTLPEAAGKRFLIDSGGIWFRDVALLLEQEFKGQGYKITTRMAPKFIVSVVAVFDKTLQMVMPRWGHQLHFENSAMRKVLGIEPRAKEETIIDMAYSMIDNGLVPKTSQYKARPHPGSLTSSPTSFHAKI